MNQYAVASRANTIRFLARRLTAFMTITSAAQMRMKPLLARKLE